MTYAWTDKQNIHNTTRTIYTCTYYTIFHGKVYFPDPAVKISETKN